MGRWYRLQGVAAMTPRTLNEWHPRSLDGLDIREAFLALLERKLLQEERHLEDLNLACAPSIMRDHQSGRVAMLKELIAQLGEQQRVINDV